MSIYDIISGLPSENDLNVIPRRYFNHSVEFKKTFSEEERMKMLVASGLNVFFYPSEMVTGCDMLSDSGTSTMTNEQWAALHMGDEAYGSNRGYFFLRDAVRDLFGEDFFDNLDGSFNAFIFHQGRSAENALFKQIGKTGEGMIIPSNGHFDTTHANIEANGIEAVNLFSPELRNPNSTYSFKGDIDIERLKNLISEKGDKIPLCYLTITNNTGGGQPVSMHNIRETAMSCRENDIPLFLDACRFAENAWFIKRNEKGYSDKPIEDIVSEMFSYCDGFTISFKKDGLANMGGGLFLKDKGLFVRKYPDIPDSLMNHLILTEGNHTYGGMSGRDIMALVAGLKTITKEEYLDSRINQVMEFAKSMKKKGLPVLTPSGGHAIYMDMNKFFEDTDMKADGFGGISFVALLLAKYGHRACELGNFAFGKFDPDTGKEILPEINFVRFAIPRLRYEKRDLESVACACKALYDARKDIPSVKILHGRELALRHFKAKFEFIS